MVARAAATTRRIRLGSGVSTLAYHHPKTLLERAVQLDHMTRGRFMFGVGAGAVALDSLMLGLDPMNARTAMAEMRTLLGVLRLLGVAAAERPLRVGAPLRPSRLSMPT